MSRPSNAIVPVRARIRPEIVRSSVVFPAPFAPISVTISPGCATMPTPFSA